MLEPTATAVLLMIFGVLIAFSVLFTRTLDRLGVPVVLLFLVLGMLGGSEGLGGIAFYDYETAFRLGTIALVLILFDGGLNTAKSSIRRSIAPAGLLATVGVFGTAGILALLARLMGLSWTEALLIGAIVSSTDAAAVFAVLRGGSLKVREPARSTLEVESCVNDPMAVTLTIVLVEVFKTSGTPGVWVFAFIPAQLAIGGLVGFLLGHFSLRLINRVTLGTTGLYPVLTLSIAFLSFGTATLLYGSGFLSVFVTAAVLGNGPLPYKAGLTRVHDAMAWFSQVSMFLMLGLLVFPSELLDVAWLGLGLALLLAIVARPIAAYLCLLPFRWKREETAYTACIGIRGAVPIILATIPVMADLPGSDRIFNIVFFIVVASTIIPGSVIVALTRRLGLEDHSPATPKTTLEIHSLRQRNGSIHVYQIHEGVAVSGTRLSAIPFPETTTVLLIVRGEDLLPAKGKTKLMPGDFVYIFCHEHDESWVTLLFGHKVE